MTEQRKKEILDEFQQRQESFYFHGILQIIKEIRKEIESRPQYPNIGKKGCIKRLEKLLESAEKIEYTLIDLKDKVANLETSKKLKDAGFPQETEFCYLVTGDICHQTEPFYPPFVECATPLACEVLAQLPNKIGKVGFEEYECYLQITRLTTSEYLVGYTGSIKFIKFRTINLATALADLWLWAKKEGYIK